VLTPWTRTAAGGLGPPGAPKFCPPASQWCFEGGHTTAPLPSTDRRRVQKQTVALTSGPNLQTEIDALKADTVTLTITSGNGFYDDDAGGLTLEKHLPALAELQLVDVAFSKIVLNEALTPSLTSLRMQNVPDEADLTLELPKLKSCSIHFLGECDEEVNKMLRLATTLETFDSYKLWVGELHFASNDLTSVDLHRSDALDTLTLYAPYLESLGLQACYGLETLTFRKTHPTLSALLPAGHVPPPLSVNTTNANLSRQAKMALRNHGNVVPSRSRHQGMPTESLFASMGGMMGGGGFGDGFDEEDDDDYDNDDDDDDEGMMPPGFAGMPPGFAQMMQMMQGAGPNGEGLPPELMQMMMGMGGMPGVHMGMDDEDEDDEGEEEEESEEEEEDDDNRIEEIDNVANPPPLQ